MHDAPSGPTANMNELGPPPQTRSVRLSQLSRATQSGLRLELGKHPIDLIT